MTRKGLHPSPGYNSRATDLDAIDTLVQTIGRPTTALLHHYTTAEGLMGIAEHKVVYASHISSLNDLGEFHDAMAMIDPNLWMFESMDITPIQSIVRGFVKDGGHEFFVASFTEDDDNIPMWSGYADGRSGYSMGFDTLKLAETGNGQLLPVWYGVDKANEVCGKLLSKYLELRNEVDRGTGPFTRRDIDSAFLTCILMLSHVCKREDFAYEREWRLVVPIDKKDANSNQYVKFRGRDGLLVPFVEHPLPAIDNHLDLRTLRCGPSLRDAETLKFADLLLWKYKIPITATQSSVRMR